jgi:hypothetical protein
MALLTSADLAIGDIVQPVLQAGVAGAVLLWFMRWAENMGNDARKAARAREEWLQSFIATQGASLQDIAAALKVVYDGLNNVCHRMEKLEEVHSRAERRTPRA